MIVCMTHMHIRTLPCLKFTLGYHDMIYVTRVHIRIWHPNVIFRVCVRYDVDEWCQIVLRITWFYPSKKRGTNNSKFCFNVRSGESVQDRVH